VLGVVTLAFEEAGLENVEVRQGNATRLEFSDGSLDLSFFITVLGGMTALTRCPIGPIRSTPETRQMLKRLFEEIAALASASGAPLAPDAWERALSMADRLPPTAYSSLHHDLIHGRRLEIEALQGYAVRLGERFGIPTPMLFAVYAALKPSEHGAPSP